MKKVFGMVKYVLVFWDRNARERVHTIIIIK